LDFYIDAILNSIGVRNVDVYAASTEFQASGLKVQYTSPGGNKLDNAFKEMYTRFFLEKGYQVIYVGNGFSDIQPARLAYHVFARDELLDHCQQIRLRCTTFNDFNDVVSGLKNLNL
jgi:2-hydroxy-3-keto-5-methylthiopentenyl-1-phosphate phosphatase